jgi:uncharacterized protein (TIGR00255 family)
MTGYGSGTGEDGGVRATVEIRTLNHRHLDVRVAAPPGCVAAAAAVEQLVRQRLGRGRVDVVVLAEGEVLDRERFAAVGPAYRALERVRAELGVAAPIDLGAVFLATTASGSGGRGGPRCTVAVTAAARQALDEVDRMRLAEGAVLQQRLVEVLDRLEGLVSELRQTTARLREALPGRLRERMELLAQAAGLRPIDEERLRQDLALLLDRSDVREEADRLVCHVGHLRETLIAAGSVGRRGEFLAMEVLREAGTLAAKAQDAVVSQRVSDLRALAEQLREQLQNVE